MDNEAVNYCSICGKEWHDGEMVKNGFICRACIPEHMRYSFYGSSTIIYKPEDEAYSYGGRFLIVAGDFKSDLLTLPYTPYTVAFLTSARGNIQDVSHEVHLLFYSEVPISINGINRSNDEIYVTLFDSSSVDIERLNVYSLTVKSEGDNTATIADSHCHLFTSSGPDEDEKHSFLSLDNTSIDNAHLSGSMLLETSDCTMFKAFIQVQEWHDKNSLINSLSETVMELADLDGTSVNNGLLTLTHGKLTNCKLSLSQNDDIVVVGNETRIVLPLHCGLCKKLIRSSSIVIKGFTVHTTCWQRDGGDHSNFCEKGYADDKASFSIELEMNGSERDSDYSSLVYDLLEYGFLRCSDGTVTDELKSPIFKNMDDFMEAVPLLRRAIPYINSRARTHVHLGASHQLRYMLRNNYPQLLLQVATLFENNASAVKEFFGCTSSSLCGYYYTSGRFQWLNPNTPYETIEYRLSQLVSIDQFIRLIKFMRDFTLFLEQRLQNIPFDHTRWPKTKDKVAVSILDFVKSYIENAGITVYTPPISPLPPYTLNIPHSLYTGCSDPRCRTCYPLFDDSSDDDSDDELD